MSDIETHSTWYCPKICYTGLIKPIWQSKPSGYCTCLCHKDDLGAIYTKEGQNEFVTWTDEAKERLIAEYEQTRSL
jgi:hypothetical protein